MFIFSKIILQRRKKVRKSFISILLAVIMIASLVPMAMTTAFAEPERNYTYTVSDGKAKILLGYSGNGGNITIPSTLGGYPVTCIDNYAFYNCSGLLSVTIPSSVTDIGEGVFFRCTGLTSVTIPSGVTSIGGGLFADCRSLESIAVSTDNSVYHSDGNCIIETATGTLTAGCKNSIIPDNGSVTNIGYIAFSTCKGLTSITIPDSVTSIGYHAFEDCTDLASVTIPSGVTSIDDGAFSGCKKLSTVYYAGSENEWTQIKIGSNNDPILNATIVFKTLTMIDPENTTITPAAETTKAPTETNAPTETKTLTETKTPTETADTKADNGGFGTGAIIGVIAAFVAAAAVIVAIVLKKKKA